MGEKLKVVNLCKNHILSAGIQKIFNRSEDIEFTNQQIDKDDTKMALEGAQVVFIEESLISHPIVKELIEKKQSLLFHLDLESNKVQLVLRRMYELKSVEDLVHLVKENGVVHL